MRRVCGPNTRDLCEAGGLLIEAPVGRGGVVTVRGAPPALVVPEGLGAEALDKEVGALLPELGRSAYGEMRYMLMVCAMVEKLSAAVPALLTGLGGAKLLHVCAWDGATSAIEALLALPNFLRL